MKEIKILLVDDDPGILASTARMLGKNGFNVKTVNGGGEALKTLDEWTPNLVISDMRMPKMGGAELMKKIPVKDGVLPGRIIFTGFDDDEALALSKMGEGGIFRVEKDRWEKDLIPAIQRAFELHKLFKCVWDKGKESVRQKEELNKLQLVRTMAVTLNHKINNPLSVIGLANHGLIEHFGQEKNNEIIARSVEEINEVVKKLKTLDEIKETKYIGNVNMIDFENIEQREKHG